MRHGFSYLQFLAVAALLVLIVAAVNPLVFNLLQKSFQNVAALQAQRELVRAADMIVSDLKYAEKVSTSGHSIFYQTAGVEYEYLLLNERLARRKTGIMYCTSKELKLITLGLYPLKTKEWRLSIGTKELVLNRIVQEIN